HRGGLPGADRNRLAVVDRPMNTAFRMKALIRSPLLSAVIGGVVVAVLFLLFGVTGQRRTKTIIEQAPIAAQPASNSSGGLTPHEIYVRDAPGVVFVRAQLVQQVESPFALVPQQQRSISTGSGFLIDRTGRILTNFHLIAGANKQTGVAVQFADDVSRKAFVLGVDPDDDLALLKVDMGGLAHVQPLAMGDSSTVRVGDPTL